VGWKKQIPAGDFLELWQKNVISSQSANQTLNRVANSPLSVEMRCVRLSAYDKLLERASPATCTYDVLMSALTSLDGNRLPPVS